MTPFFSMKSYTECPLLLFSGRHMYLSSLLYSSAGGGGVWKIHFIHFHHVKVNKMYYIHFHHVKARLVQVLIFFSFSFFLSFFSFFFFFRSSIKLHLTAKFKFRVIKKTLASHNHAIMHTGGWMKTVTQQTEILFSSDYGVVTTQYSSLLVVLSNMGKKKQFDFMKNFDCRQYTSDLLIKQEKSLCQPVML